MSEIAGGLQDGTLLSVEQGYFLHIVQRKLPQVYLSVLCIAQFHTVVADAQMVGTHRADIHRLNASYATIVLQLNTGEVAKGVGHTVRRQFLQLFTCQGLRGDDLLMIIARHDDNLIHVLDAVETTALGEAIKSEKRNVKSE